MTIDANQRITEVLSSNDFEDKDSHHLRRELGNRLRDVEKRFANRAAAAKAAGVAKSTLQSWIEGNAGASFEGMARLAKAADVSLDWLAYGELVQGKERPTHYVEVPRYDIRLSAGDGSYFERAHQIDRIPFTREFFASKLERLETEGVVALEVIGDSMLPTLADGDLVLVDTWVRSISDGIYAIAIGDDLLVKRLQRRVGGGVSVLSDNDALYKPIELTEEEAEANLHVFGRLCWSAKVH